MRSPCLRKAFTLIEVLIVVVIMAILAGTIITSFSSSTLDAKQSILKSNMHTMRAQIELYQIDHTGSYPTIQNNDLPQLDSATNGAGAIGVPGLTFPFGPYVDDVSANPFDNSAKVSPVAVSGEEPSGVVGTLGGWQYDEVTGGIWPNNPEYYQ